ncbi:MAG: thiamine-phosphate kinase [Myxococcota bacterium]|nr:thiamine-phosphate kinase [Myxococcota bacterium]
MELIARIDRCVSRASSSSKSRAIVLGIGDDAALLRARSGEEVAVSTDTAVEGVHFDWRVDDASAIGRRALAAALSDLAAMGARPLGCTLALAVDANLELRRLDASLRAFVDEAEKRGCTLSGGNVASAGETSFAVTVVGAVARGKALLRSSTRAGDGLFVTGMLGGAALARAVAGSRGGRPSNRFVPPDRLAAGRALAGLATSRRRPACIDLSDGLAADLPHLLAGSAGKRLGAEVELDRLPRVRGFERRCVDVGLDPVEALVGGGEDYELLFTLSGRWAQESQLGVLEARLGAPVTRIGHIGERPGIRGLPRRYSGYRHF